MLFVLLLLWCATVKGAPSYDVCDLKCANLGTDPCEDFYEFVCGNFKRVNERPQEFELWDRFVIKQEELQDQVAAILTEGSDVRDSDVLKKAKAAFKACMDTAYADMLDYPEVQILKKLGPWPLISSGRETPEFSWDEVGDVTSSYGVSIYFSVTVYNNLLDTSQLTIMIGPAITPDKSIRSLFNDVFDSPSLRIGSKNTQIFQNFINQIATVLRDATGSYKSNDAILSEIKKLIRFIKLFQEAGSGANDLQFFTVEELQSWIEKKVNHRKHLDILKYLRRVFGKSGIDVKPHTAVFVTNIKFLDDVLELVNESDDDLLRNFMFTKLFTLTSRDSNKLMRKAYENFRSELGRRKLNRSEYCTQFLLGYPNGVAFSMAISHELQKGHNTNDQLAIIRKISDKLQKFFNQSISAASWLDKASKDKALLKLDRMLNLFGYPGMIESHSSIGYYYSNVRICAWDHFGNAQIIRAFGIALNLALLDVSEHRKIWNRSPLIVGSFYNHQYNRIMLPMGVLNLLGDNDTSSAIQYGTIGSILSHEIGHGFDSNGYLYDENGSLNPWLSAESRVKFEKRRDCFISQYDKYYIPEIGEYVNPNSSLNENLADNIGLQKAYKAYKTIIAKPNEFPVGNFTLEQSFFVAYGTLWCSQQTPEYLKKQQTISYAPAKYRVIGSISNSKDFAKAFNCPLGSNMNPTKKCLLL